MDELLEPGTQVSEVAVDPVLATYALRESLLEPPLGALPRLTGAPLRGRRLRVEAGDRSGLYLRARRPRGPLQDLALDASLRAAAQRRGGEPAGTLPTTGVTLLEPGDLREKVRVRRASASLVFIVDASGSMRRNRRMVETKTAVLSLLMSAYTSRDRVAIVAFRGAGAEVVLPFTGSVDHARRLLERLPAGGRTPLAEGLRLGTDLAMAERKQRPQSSLLLVVLSDGKPNWSRSGLPVQETELASWTIRRARLPLLFLDTDPTWQEPGMGPSIARITRGRYLALSELSAEAILRAVSLRDTLTGFLDPR